jgi:hypothetical protein
MTTNHWRAIAILGGLAIGFFATSYVAGSTWPKSWGLKLYNSGVSAGGNYTVG